MLVDVDDTVIYVAMLLTTIGVVLSSTVSRLWLCIATNVMVVDVWYSQSLGSTTSTYISVPMISSFGAHRALSLSPSHVVLVSGIAIAMHGVSTYAHSYMGYEVLLLRGYTHRHTLS
jgi:hypothetical protein